MRKSRKIERLGGALDLWQNFYRFCSLWSPWRYGLTIYGGKKVSQLNKDETFWSVLNSAIELDFRRGHLRWTMSELSRMSKVTRSLIYYYFGKSKESILLEAVKLIGEEFFGLNGNRIELWQQGKIVESVLQSRHLLDKCPHMGTFYMVHRDETTEIGASLRELEAEYKQKLKRFFAKASEPSREAIFGLFMGLVVTPRLSDEAVSTGVNGVLRLSKLGDES